MSALPRVAVLALAGGAVVLTTACSLSINTDGHTVTQSFEVDDFDSVEIAQPFDATVTVGEETGVEVEINEELVDRLEVEVDGDRLVVQLTGGLVASSGPMVVHITTPELAALSADGAANVEIDGLDAESFDLRVDGASNVSADGSVTTLTLDANGASNVDFEQVSVGTASVTVDGAANADFDALDEIRGSVKGAGSVDVSNETSVDVSTSGAGSIG
ncbi:MAG: GIN domain-containing protein [Acidimicrobiales bacterium]